MKAPSVMASLSRAASGVGLSIKKVGVAAYQSADAFAAKRPLVAAVGGLAYMLVGGLACVAVPLISPMVLPMMLGASLYAARGLKHLFNPVQSHGYVPIDQQSESTPEHFHQDVSQPAYR